MRDSDLIVEAAQAALLEKIYRYLAEREIAEATLGNLSAHNSTVVEKLRRGRLTFRLGDKIERYIAAERQARTILT